MCGEDGALAQTFIFVHGVFTGLYVTWMNASQMRYTTLQCICKALRCLHYKLFF